jgi:thiol-disulfide isomerase/thioredoxin
MADSNLPDFFTRFPMRAVRSEALDAALVEAEAPPLTLLFLWGYNCPNCDVAKRAILVSPERFGWDEVRWLHCNVYDDPEMANRFGLHGVPAFFVFREGKRVGRITGWPGAEAFTTAIAEQLG